MDAIAALVQHAQSSAKFSEAQQPSEALLPSNFPLGGFKKTLICCTDFPTVSGFSPPPASLSSVLALLFFSFFARTLVALMIQGPE